MNNNLSTPEALSTSQVTTSSQGYNGYFKLEDGILSFTGCSVQLRNISQISNYPVRPINYINGRMIFWACLLFIGSLAYSKGLNRYDSDDKTIAYTLAVCFAGIILYGIIERLRPDNYAITIELSSGFRHYFVHKSKVFIDETYKAFVIAIQQNRSFLAVFNNTTNTISIGDGSIVGDIHGNTQGNSNTGLASSINHFNSGSGNVVGNVEGNTQQNGNIAAQRGNSSNTMNLGSNNVLGNVGGNRQTNG